MILSVKNGKMEKLEDSLGLFAVLVVGLLLFALEIEA